MESTYLNRQSSPFLSLFSAIRNVAKNSSIKKYGSAFNFQQRFHEFKKNIKKIIIIVKLFMNNYFISFRLVKTKKTKIII